MYRATWARFDNATGGTTPIGRTESVSTAMAAPRNLPDAVGTIVEIDITAASAAHASWQQPVRTYFRRTAGGWNLVGLERLADDARETGATLNATQDR